MYPPIDTFGSARSAMEKAVWNVRLGCEMPAKTSVPIKFHVEQVSLHVAPSEHSLTAALWAAIPEPF